MGMRLGYYYLTLDWLEFTKLLGLGSRKNDQDLVESLYQVAIQLHNFKYKSDTSSQLAELHSLVDPIISSSSASSRVPYRTLAIQNYGKKYGNYTLNYLNMYSLCKGDEFQVRCDISKRFHKSMLKLYQFC